MSAGSLFELVRRSFDAYGDRACLEVGGECYSYADVGSDTARIAAVLQSGVGGRVGLLAARSLTAYSGALAILAVGSAYVPLHPGWPLARIVDIIRRARVNEIVVGNECLALMPALSAACGASVRFVVPHARVEQIACIDESAIPRGAALPGGTPASADDYAYILFTSGTTGRPKGVPIHNRNIVAHIRALQEAEPLRADDRCSQFFDLTFDPSVHDIFLTWMAGACLCVVPDHARIAPGGFIRDSHLTCWYSVPSVIVLMQRLRMLKPDAFPELRLSRFGGEALLEDSASAWSAAAPGSLIENMYGPTECTCTSVRHVWSPGGSERNGVVPIGAPVGTLTSALLTSTGETLEVTGIGELCLSGDQVSSGYLDDEALTREKYVRLDASDGTRWYRTGDLVERDEAGLLHYLGRLDDQVQVQGNRVELAEIDEALRHAAGTTPALAIPWPFDSPRVETIFGFVPSDCAMSNASIRSAMADLVPRYMVPERILRVDVFPLSENGKYDRRALADLVVSLSAP